VSVSGLDAVLPLLACPHCTQPLTRQGDGVVGCEPGHRFDLARQGYLSLLGKGSRTDTGDSADMVDARVAFLGAGHYRPIADAIGGRVTAGPVVEIGAGTGYYLACALDRLRDPGSGSASGLALDASRYAARRAAADPRIGSIVADAWSRLPIRDRAASTVLSVFAPRDPAEIARVLVPTGRLVVVTPEPEHLAEIRSAVGLLGVDPGKPGRLDEAFDGLLRPVDRLQVRAGMRLTRSDVAALVRMGPAARHVSPDQLQRSVNELAEFTTVTMAVTVSVFAAG
jgi:23S rRNA (guanine745-N1)-methyltransferase